MTGPEIWKELHNSNMSVYQSLVTILFPKLELLDCGCKNPAIVLLCSMYCIDTNGLTIEEMQDKLLETTRNISQDSSTARFQYHFLHNLVNIKLSKPVFPL